MLVAALPADAALFADYDADRHDRFLADGLTANPDFHLANIDLTGVGVGRNGGVLLSDQHVLVANHYRGSSYAFVNQAGERITISSQSHTRLQTDVDGTFVGSDLSVATLSRPVTESEGLTPISLYGGTADDLAGEVVHAYDQNDRLGRNLINGGLISTPTGTIDLPPVELYGDASSSATWAIGYDFDLSNPLGNDEIGLVGGDSGHAALHVSSSGDVSLLGTHFAVVTSNGGFPRDPGDRYVSLSSFVGPYRDQIAAITGGGVTSIAAIPEPGITLIGTFVGGLLVRRRR